jgi:hypothetical protein
VIGDQCLRYSWTPRGLAVATFQDSTEFAFAANASFGLRGKVYVENRVVSTNSPYVQPLSITFGSCFFERSSQGAFQWVTCYIAQSCRDFPDTLVKKKRRGIPWRGKLVSFPWVMRRGGRRPAG